MNYVSAGENSCDFKNSTGKKRKCRFPSRTFGSHSIFCGCKTMFVNKAPGKAAFAERQLEIKLPNESKLDPKVCTIPRPQEAERLSNNSSLATHLGVKLQFHCLCLQALQDSLLIYSRFAQTPRPSLKTHREYDSTRTRLY